MAEIRSVFAHTVREKRPAFVGFMTAGFPTPLAFVDMLFEMEAGGCDIIEVGVPFTDPIAEGVVIQQSNQVALEQGTESIHDVLRFVKDARARGLKVPIVLMGYYNPFLVFGTDALMKECSDAGVQGFIIVDLPPEEAIRFREKCLASGLSNIPLIAPTTTDKRISELASVADSFIYIVSVKGVTGVRASTNSDLPDLIKRVRDRTDLPIAIGFGVGNREQFLNMAALGDGVIIGSAIIKQVQAHTGAVAQGKAVREFCSTVCGRTGHEAITASDDAAIPQASATDGTLIQEASEAQRFGDFGGRFVPETLMEALDELTRVYTECKADPAFKAEIEQYNDYVGRPSRMHLADHLTREVGGANIWLKREDLNHTGAHKINNAIGQLIVARRLGKKRIIAETGAGQHGVATATVCAKFGFECIVYMGAKDVERQALNVFRMKMMGATVIPVQSGQRTLKDAINEAMRDWVTNITTTHYLVGSAIGPHPFPEMVRDLQCVIGIEAREQMLREAKKLPDYIVACVGGGSNAIGIFHPFVDDKEVNLVGVEAAGEGIETNHHSATLSCGTPGVLHGTRTYLLQTKNGQIGETHSICAGLDYPGVGPEHAFLKDSGRATYAAVTDEQALVGFMALATFEGILPALETAHAVYEAIAIAKRVGKGKDILINISGRGDKDVDQLHRNYLKDLPSLTEKAVAFVTGA